jgi:DNA segregation ATPase FtsK/SpoIIIE, S-DNA-T family
VPLYHRYATTPTDAIDLLTDYRNALTERKAYLKQHGMRRAQVSRDTPFELLIIDEIAMLTAYGPKQIVREAIPLLSEIMTQGRAGPTP